MVDCSRSLASSSEDVVLIGVHLLERLRSALVQDTLGLKAFVLVESVSGHAGSKGTHVSNAELSENGLSWRVLILSWEAI